MMSAHDVAVAALNEVTSNPRSESRGVKGENAPPRSGDDTTAASIGASASKDAPITDPREPNASLTFQSSSSNYSQTTVPDVTTPPSSDGFSSQSQHSPLQLSQPSQSTATHQPNPHPTETVAWTPAVATNAGQKRTLEGYVKPSGSRSSSSVSPPLASFSGHSRNISSVSSTANSRELVSELRTRLSYAIVKVNKGWEDLPIEEVESRTSQAGSPSSSTSTLHGRRNIITSPRTAIANVQGNSRDLLPYSHLTTASSSQVDPTIYSDGQPSRTYESFWREQGQRSSQGPANLGSSASRNLSLAPSADITSAARNSTNPRRSETPKFAKPPTLLGRSTSDLSQNTQLSMGTHAPRTPNRTSHPVDSMLDKTNQKSLQERDAIETLIFMSSPGNSNSLGHTFPPPGHASQQPSPLRAEFGPILRGAAERNVEFTGIQSYVVSDAGSATPLAKTRSHTGTGQSRPGDDVYDIMLDGMQDTDSSDDEIEIPITPRRVVVSQI